MWEGKRVAGEAVRSTAFLVKEAADELDPLIELTPTLRTVRLYVSHTTDHCWLQPEKVVFPPLDAMTPAEQQELGNFAGQTVDTGPEAEGFARYIGGHLAEVNEGATYSETSSAAREEGLDPKTAADLQEKADSLFKGETLRSILLNAYGWWTIATIALYVGIALIVAGLVLGFFSLLGFRHAHRAVAVSTSS